MSYFANRDHSATQVHGTRCASGTSFRLTIAVHDGGVQVAQAARHVRGNPQHLAEWQAAVGAMDDIVQAARQQLHHQKGPPGVRAAAQHAHDILVLR